MAKQAYDSLTEAANADIIKQWSAEEEDAQARQAEDVLSMDLFDVHTSEASLALQESDLNMPRCKDDTTAGRTKGVRHTCPGLSN